MTECFLPPSSSPAEQRRAEHPGGVARTPSSEEISPTKFPGLYRTGEPSPPHDGHHHEPPDAYVSDDDKEHSKKKNKFKKKEKRSKMLFWETWIEGGKDSIAQVNYLRLQAYFWFWK